MVLPPHLVNLYNLFTIRQVESKLSRGQRYQRMSIDCQWEITHQKIMKINMAHPLDVTKLYTNFG